MVKTKVIHYVENTKWNEVIELNRMAFSDVLPRNSESRALSIAFKLIKKYYPKIDLKDEEQKETFGKFDSIMLDHYESDNQITFFVPNGETTYTLGELTDILI